MNRPRTNCSFFLLALWVAVAVGGYFAGTRDAKAKPAPPCRYTCACENVKAYLTDASRPNSGIIHYEVLANGDRTVVTHRITSMQTTNVCDYTNVSDISETVHENDYSSLVPLCATNAGKVEVSLPGVILFPPLDDRGFGRQQCVP